MNCNKLISNIYEFITYIDFVNDNIITDTIINYEISFIALDMNKIERSCMKIPSIIISLLISSFNTMPITIPPLIVSIINNGNDHSNDFFVSDIIRLFGNINNYNIYPMDYYYKYYWKEISGKLTNDELKSKTISKSINNKNLIMDSYQLIEGNSYMMQLKIEQYSSNDELLQTSFSTSFQINIIKINTIVIVHNNNNNDGNDSNQNSWICVHRFVDSFNQLFNISLNITVFDNYQNYLPFYYEFKYKINENNSSLLLHSSLFNESYFNSFILPPIWLIHDYDPYFELQ